MTDLESLLQDIPQLLADLASGVLNLDIAPLLGDLLSGKGSLGVPPSRVGPPLLDLLNLLLVLLLLGVNERGHAGYGLLQQRRNECLDTVCQIGRWDYGCLLGEDSRCPRGWRKR